jgi:type I restriction enzyme S subunit
VNAKPYPKYKLSGVEWLGDVPEHWEVKRLKWVGEAIIGLTYSPDDVVNEGDGTLVLRSSNIQDGKILLDDNVFVSSEIPRRLRTRPKDIVICTRNGSRALVGKTGMISETESDLTFGAFTAVFRSPANDYMFYVFNSGLFSFQAGLFQTSTIFQLTNGTINSFLIPLPPSGEQQAIATFLDYRTVKLDALLEKKRALIGKLKEKRGALISRTVTKGLPPEAAAQAGLNPTPKHKPSGIPWLGDIPEHWSAQKFGRCAFFQEGPGLRNWQFTVEGVKVICVTNITERGIDFTSFTKFISEDEYFSSYRHFTVSSGDLLLASSGNSWGKVAQYLEKDTVILNTSTIRINRNAAETLKLPFILWTLQSETTREQLKIDPGNLWFPQPFQAFSFI